MKTARPVELSRVKNACLCDSRERERGGRASEGSLLYNVAEPVCVVLGGSHCAIAGLTDVVI